MRVSIAFILILLTWGACGGNVLSDKEFPIRSVAVKGVEYKYRIFVPEGRDPAQKIPVMLYLHGSGARGDDNQKQAEGFRYFIPNDPKRYDFAIVMPQCRGDGFWNGQMNEMAMAALENTIKELNGDESRLYLAGFSMGAYGVWHVAATNPGRFAALVPIAGGVLPNGPLPEGEMAKISPEVRAAATASDPYEAFAKAIGDTPVWIFHGDADQVVPVEGSRKMFEKLKATGNNRSAYTELPGVGHDALPKVFGEPKLFEWLAKQRR